MTWPPGAKTSAHRCRLDNCGGNASRRCRVCSRWVCKAHRFGAGQWFHCYECPPEALAEVLRAWREQEREEKAAARAEEEAEAARIEQLGPPHLSPPGTVRAGVIWGLWSQERLQLMRELVDSLGLPRARGRDEPPQAPTTHAHRPTGRKGPRRARAGPWRELRRWRRQAAARRGYGAPMLPRSRQRARREARALPVWTHRARVAVAAAVALVLALVPLRFQVPPVVAELAPAPPALAPVAPDATTELSRWTVDVYAEAQPPRPDQAPRPVRGQKRAPCVEGLEVDVGGYCWLPVKARPPNCPPQTVAYGGDCLLPMAPQQRPPTSIDAGEPE